MKKQAEAMDIARAQALTQLEAAQGHQPEPVQGDIKGPRGTFDTATSGPSFGHLLHQDGMPISRHMSMQSGTMQGNNVPRGLTSFGGAPLMRIPFGVPMGAKLPRPMMAMRTGTGIGMGIGLDTGTAGTFRGASMEPILSGLMESPESANPKRTDRSAFVESVEDVSRLRTGWDC